MNSKTVFYSIVVFFFFITGCNHSKVDTAKENNIRQETSPNDSLSEIPVEEPYVDPMSIDNSEQVKEAKSLLTKYPELKNYTLFEKRGPVLIKGDFFGDGIQDVALPVSTKGKVKICVINIGNTTAFHFMGNKPNDLEEIDDYSWIGDFEKVKPGEVLYSNYTDDFRDLEDVPEDERVKLDYDAIYVHADESCGGGFIFWKDGKFNWLQQE